MLLSCLQIWGLYLSAGGFGSMIPVAVLVAVIGGFLGVLIVGALVGWWLLLDMKADHRAELSTEYLRGWAQGRISERMNRERWDA